jgi:hypothetical protein
MMLRFGGFGRIASPAGPGSMLGGDFLNVAGSGRVSELGARPRMAPASHGYYNPFAVPV